MRRITLVSGPERGAAGNAIPKIQEEHRWPL
jgi:hypothetical protein